MVGGLRKILPIQSPIHVEKEDDDDKIKNLEYSFALPYSGPLLTCDVPRVVPIDFRQIPIASPAIGSGSLLTDVSLPVVQPIVKSPRKPSKKPNLVSDRTVCLETDGGMDGNGMPCEASRVDVSSASLCANDDECGAKLSDGIRSSGRLDFFSGCVSSGELPRSLEVSELPDNGSENEGRDFYDYVNPANNEAIGSESSHINSSEIFSCQEEDHNEEAPGHVRRPSIVTFREPESNYLVDNESDVSNTDSSVHEKHIAVRPGKKGTCYRCMKGSRLTEKEVCIVCGAKYCSNCVIRAMGSMPEGRKCVTCIGKRIDESRRKTLGKCSRMLKQLLPVVEVEQIMRSERSCVVNQPPPELIYVNRQRLSKQELFLLLTCPNPPKKLKPGYYWYDKVSGLWGKEGHKPRQIISPQLTVGGHIQEDASNGNTNIMINNRKITKAELIMLQWAGVKCEGATHLWVSADGAYQEEGMNNIKGKLWIKTGIKLICAVLSLPTPPNSVSPSGEGVNDVMANKLEQKTLYKLLLVGLEKSGTCTIFKQARIVYSIPFSEDERQSIKSIIQCNLYGYLGILLEGRERFEEECLIDKRRKVVHQHSSLGQIDCKTIYSIGPRLKAFSDWLLQVIASGNLESMIPAAAREYAPFVEELRRDGAFQATYNRRNELKSLPRVATYFLERAVEVARPDYQPSDMDILYAEGFGSSKGLSSMEFSFPKVAPDFCENIGYQHDPLLRYQLIRVHPTTLGGNCKRLEMFEDVDVVLFCVSLIDYDEFSEDKNGVLINKMIASRQLFERTATHPAFEEKKFLLILNKFDLLEEKIEQVPLTQCEWFDDFNPVIGYNPNNSRSTNPSLARRASQYIAVKFKRLFRDLTDRKLYVSLATGFEPDNVDEAFKYAREVLKWEQEELNYPNNELSSTSIEASSSS
ncbi:extra-large guanine nucleotide-binding protein 1-like isoform X1 [Populus alba x Populus x berolinensis]|nr:extra-large guanine nucleotide-binding protein 1-like isoform X1 [Populus alba x Populus x berolinensis]